MTTGRSWLRPLATPGAPPMAIWNERPRRQLASIVEPAFDRESRNRGLLGRAGLPPGHALVLAPCKSIHTFFMRFAIDVLFVASSGEVLRVSKRVPPWRIALSLRAEAVVELVAGGSDEADIRVGDMLTLVPAGPSMPAH